MKMNVLFIVKSMNTGGLEKYVKNLLIYELNQQFKCDCLICEELSSDYEAELIKCNINIYHIPSPDRLKISLYMNVKKFIEVHKDYDIVHCHMAGTNGILAKATRDAGIKAIVCHSHGVSLAHHESFQKRIYMNLMRKLMQKNANAFIGCSKAAGEYLFGAKFFEKKGFVIPNGIQLINFVYSKNKRTRIRKNLGIHEGAFVVGHTGSLNSVKNQEHILEITRYLKDEIPSIKTILVGTGENENDLRCMSNKLDIEDRVILTGKQNNVDEYLSAMDVFVFPSKSEGFGLSLLEAEANGLPCVVSDRIQPEVKALDNVFTVALSAPIEQWGEAIINAKKVGRIYDAIEKLKDRRLDEVNCYNSVLQIYEEIIK